jgi:hypothetical protein
MIIPSIYSGITGNKDIVVNIPNAGFMKTNLTNRQPLQMQTEVYKPKMFSESLGCDTSRRVISCRNDLRVKVGKKSKEKSIVRPSLVGVGRNTQSTFAIPPNDLPLMPAYNSNDVSRISKLSK